MRSRRPWCFLPPTTAATSRERNCLWMAASHKCRRSAVHGKPPRADPQLRVVPSLQNQGKIGQMPAMGVKPFSDRRLKSTFLPGNPCASHDLRHSDRTPLVGCFLHHAHGRIIGRLCGVRRASCRLGAVGVPTCFSCAFCTARRIACPLIYDQRSRPCRLDREPSRPIEICSLQGSQPASRCSQPRSPF
jgi:hypothetical protein